MEPFKILPSFLTFFLYLITNGPIEENPPQIIVNLNIAIEETSTIFHTPTPIIIGINCIVLSVKKIKLDRLDRKIEKMANRPVRNMAKNRKGVKTVQNQSDRPKIIKTVRTGQLP